MNPIARQKQKKSPIENGDKTEYRDEKGRFVKDNPGGPGHPLGQRNFHTDFDEVVEEIAKLNNITISEARKILLKKAYTEAKDGNFPFYKDILDRYYGKAEEKWEIKPNAEVLFALERVLVKMTKRR